MNKGDGGPVLMPPMDEHNRTLIGNVHPPDWVNPEPAERYNLVVIGGGTAGLVTAAGAAGLGAKVALVERHLLGGDCLNVGCIPSKCLIAAAKAYAGVRDAGRFGVVVPEGTRVDFAAVMERMRRLRADVSHHDSAQRFRRLGVDVFLGGARFSGIDRIEVAGRTLHFRRAVIATGARATAPPVEGLADTGYLTNETVFSLTELPPRLAILGAGPIGCELAQAFQRFGSQVTLLELMPRILPREDAEAATVIEGALLRDGVELLVGARVESVRRRGSDKILHIHGEDGGRDLCVDEILVGVGRIPNTDGLGLERVGVDFDSTKGVLVDDRLQTSQPHIYAAGDVCSSVQFTHAADAMARVVIQNALFPGSKKVSSLTIPRAIFTDPEVAQVGLDDSEAAAVGLSVDTYRRDLKDVDRAVVDGQTEGFVKIRTQRGGDRILGATIVARHAGDLISEITLALTHDVGLGALAGVIHPYPTQAEAIRQSGDAYNRSRLTPLVKGILERWLAWTR